jgi:hypothetical protein
MSNAYHHVESPQISTQIHDLHHIVKALATQIHELHHTVDYLSARVAELETDHLNDDSREDATMSLQRFLKRVKLETWYTELQAQNRGSRNYSIMFEKINSTIDDATTITDDMITRYKIHLSTCKESSKNPTDVTYCIQFLRFAFH